MIQGQDISLKWEWTGRLLSHKPRNTRLPLSLYEHLPPPPPYEATWAALHCFLLTLLLQTLVWITWIQ